jgi:hypothetical protein
MNVHDSTIIGLAKENRPATKNRRVNVEQGIMNIEGKKQTLQNSTFSPRRRLYPPACKPYGLEAEPEALFDIRYSFFNLL